MVEVRQVKLSDGRRRERKLENIRRFVVHRISFRRDDGGGGYWKVNPIHDHALTGDDVVRRFMDCRTVPEGDRRVDKHGNDVEWRDRPGSYTGGEVPYQLIGLRGGGVDQALEIADYGPHARRWSWTAIGYAAVGDHDVDHPEMAQWEDAIEMAALFSAWFGRRPHDCVFGHDELPGGSADASKRCPGQFWDMEIFRLKVREHRYAALKSAEAEQVLGAMGVVF